MADLNSALVKFVIGVVILFSLIFLVTKEANVYDDSVDKQICKQAVRSMAMTKVKGQDTLQLFNKRNSQSDVKCPIFYKEISPPSKDALKSKMAEFMYDSWDMMGEGRLELFSAEDQETYCILTHHIGFKDKTKDMGKVSGFVDYLSSEKIPDDNLSYFEYLHCYNTNYNPQSIDKFNPELDVIDTSQDYGIMFVYSKKEHLHKVWSGFEGLKAGTILGGIGAVLMLFPEPTITKAAGGAFLIGAGAIGGSALGYSQGSDTSADWSACVVLFPYNEEYLSKFECTYMPGVQGTR